jgi:hypothetical protein
VRLEEIHAQRRQEEPGRGERTPRAIAGLDLQPIDESKTLVGCCATANSTPLFTARRVLVPARRAYDRAAICKHREAELAYFKKPACF